MNVTAQKSKKQLQDSILKDSFALSATTQSKFSDFQRDTQFLRASSILKSQSSIKSKGGKSIKSKAGKTIQF